MRLRLFVIIGIILGMHSPLCTGGVFAAFTDAIDYVAYAASEQAQMTHGNIGYLSCKDASSDEVEVGTNAVGCSNSSECLASASAAFRASLHSAISALDLSTTIAWQSENFDVLTVAHQWQLPKRPPPQKPLYLANIVVKRE